MKVSNLAVTRKLGLTRAALCLSASSLAVFSPDPASAQTAMVRTVRSVTAQLLAPAIGSMTTPVRSPTMQQALANQATNQARIVAMRTVVLAARNAAVAATQLQHYGTPTDGLSTNGLVPVPVITQAMALSAAGKAADANAKLASAAAVTDTSGSATWDGAGLPSQTTDGSGNVTVTIAQTQARALLSWQKFNIGANTTLAFDQTQNHVAQTGWTAVNRVVDAVAPSLILGKITAPGTVVVLNSQGVIFGPNSQVNTQSLLVSTLELGLGTVLAADGNHQIAETLQQRNLSYLQNGLFSTAATGQVILSPNYYAAPAFNYALGTTSTAYIAQNSYSQVPLEGSIVLDAGAQVTTGTGGFIIMAAPMVDSSAQLTAYQGQVSLEGGRIIEATASSGGPGSTDPSVRGFLLRSFLDATDPGNAGGTDNPQMPALPPKPDDGIVINSGVISSRQGYISLGTGLLGKVENDGILSATTSVSRNGAIDLYAGTVALGGSTTANSASAISITPDEDGETIPQGDADNPPSFISSQINVGTYGRTINTDFLGTLTPGQFTMGQNALIYAPNANVVVGRGAGMADPLTSLIASSIDIADGATIDVAGIKDVQLAASANSVKISPVKQNELRDTPNYRPVSTNGAFTLNGTTLYIDPRISGVGADGVAWVGSPLLEAASIVSQLPETVSQLMTKGGSVTLAVNGITAPTANPAAAPHVNIAPTATIDLSGGWVNYAAGVVEVSELITADGRLLPISAADPNGVYIGVSNGFTSSQPNFGLSATFSNQLDQGLKPEPSYDEGSDAGTLVVAAPAINFGGTINGQAFAGARQLTQALQPSGTASFGAGTRKVQAAKYQLPMGAAVSIGSFSGGTQAGLGADIIVYAGTRNQPETASYGQTLLSAAMLSQAGLADLTLQTSGAVIFTSGSETLLDPAAVTLSGASTLTLAAGGTLNVAAGRTISFAGNIVVPSGTVTAETLYLATPLQPNANVVGTEFAGYGSPFDPSEAYPTLYAAGTNPATVGPHYDIDVSGNISTAGLFSNDLLVTNGLNSGPAWQGGGRISLTVAPNVFVPIGSATSPADAVDFSGSIHIASAALLDVSAGAYVSPAGAVTAAAKGGSIALIDQTVYAPLAQNYYGSDFQPGTLIEKYPNYYVVPSVTVSQVSFADSSFKAFGFAGGGTFTLNSPNLSFGSDNPAGSSHVSLQFLQDTGFGALNLTSFASQTIANPFTGGGGSAALLTTTQLAIHNGETFDLTQSLLPKQLSVIELNSLRTLATGGAVTSVLAPAVPTDAWEQLPANLILGGLTELDIDAGGTLQGAAQASVTVPKLYNAGTITIHGGTILQAEYLPALLSRNGVGIDVAGDSSTGLGYNSVFGHETGGAYDPNALNIAAALNPAVNFTGAPVYTNQQLLQTGQIYLLGRVAQTMGIDLVAGSSTDLSGTVIYNPFAPFKPDGTQVVTGRLIAGGSIGTTAQTQTFNAYFAVPVFAADLLEQATTLVPGGDANRSGYFNSYAAGRGFVVAAGATLDISGITTGGAALPNFDIAISPTAYAATPEWSDAGTMAALAGGSIGAGATILAAGGTPQASGGTLEWLRPTLTDGSVPASVVLSNPLLASQIQSAGFATLIADGGLAFAGNVSLSLRKSLIVDNAAPLTPTAIDPYLTSGLDVAISAATAGTTATVDAAYIELSGLNGRIVTDTTRPVTGNSSVTLNAGALGMDVVGAVLFNGSIASTTLTSAADLRLTGVSNVSAQATRSGIQPVLNGELLSQGNLTIDAGRTYATTGTGNLQQILENLSAGKTLQTYALPFEIDAFGNSTLTFLGTHINNTAPLSAGSYLRVQAKTIQQDGTIAAPLGLLEIGGNGTQSIAGQTVFNNSASKQPRAIATTSLTFGAGSITTVSAADVTVGGVATAIPYGTTTDLSSYYFTPTTTSALTAPPTGELLLSGGAIDVAAGAVVNGAGGGDVRAFEFVSGIGGSRDVLSRFNTDQYSANSYNPVTGIGYQYPDARQVYAIVPADVASKVAYFDPVYSADYTTAGLGAGPTHLYGTDAGLSVHLDGGNGIAAGDYVLMPAHYALLPGAYRIVENSGVAAPGIGTSTTLLDGSIVMGGSFGTIGAGLSDSTRYSFTLQSPSTFLKSSNIVQTSASTALSAQATQAGNTIPQLPIDAARLILNPVTSLTVAGTFDLTPATGGKGAKIDITGADIVIGATDPGTPGGLFLANTTLANLDANSLFIGGTRQDNADGTTTLNVVANQITVDGDALLSAPELLFAVGATSADVRPRPRLTIADNASLTATGTLSDPRDGNYLIPAVAGSAINPDVEAPAAALRLATGSQRLFTREGTAHPAPATLKIGAASLTAPTLGLESSNTVAIASGATLAAANIALAANAIRFGHGGNINDTVAAKLEAATQLTLQSPRAIAFASGTYAFNDLTIDTPAIARLANSAAAKAAVADVAITANAFQWSNTAKPFAGCRGAGAAACGTPGSMLSIAANTITLGTGAIGVTGFNDASAVKLAASNGVYLTGTGSLTIGNGAGSAASTDSTLAITAPFIIDSSAIANPASQTVKVDYSFATRGAFVLTAPTPAAGIAAPVPTGNRVPGAIIAIGSTTAPVASATIDGAAIIATAGTLDIEAQGNITLANAASLQVPGYAKTFGDNVAAVTVSAGGGTLTLNALTGDIVLPATAAIVTDNGVGSAGSLNLFASEGAVTLAAAINAAATGPRSGSLAFDAQNTAFDLSGFASHYGALFEGDLAIRAGTGDLTLGAGQTIKARSVSLTADGTNAGEGQITIAGTIDTSGQSVAGLTASQAQNIDVDGHDIALYGNNGLTLAATALLNTRTSGYLDSDTRQASAGNVTLGIASASAALTIADGAVIDVGAYRPSGQTGNRLVAQTVIDPATLAPTTIYHFVQADQGGIVTLRAPVDTTDSRVNIVLPASLPVKGAAAIQIEAFKRYDLDQLAKVAATGAIAGVSLAGGVIMLDPAQGADDTNGNLRISPYLHTRNILASSFRTSKGIVSIPYFIQHFAVTAADGSSFDPAIAVRPGVELDSQHAITLASNWNLGAGSVNTAKARAAGLLVPIPDLNGGFAADGSRYLAVVAGQEGNLLQNYTSMTYRVGASAAGAAPFLTIRAAATLTSNFSITDGFFTFRDVTDPVYMNAELGGGDRQVLPAATFSCGSLGGDCSALSNFAATEAAAGGTAVSRSSAASINLVNITSGPDVTAAVTAPFSQLANTPGALPGLTADGSDAYGNPIGAAEVFPLLNNGTAAMPSSSLRLVGGAGAFVSADPLHVDRGSQGDVSIAGEHSYTIVTTAGAASYTTNPDPNGSSLQFIVNSKAAVVNGTGARFVGADASFIANVESAGISLDATDGPELYTVLTWGAGDTPKADYLRTKAAAYFDLVNPKTYDFGSLAQLTNSQQDALRIGVSQGGTRFPAGVASSLDNVLGFLTSIDRSDGKSIAQNLAARVVSGAYAAASPIAAPPANLGPNKTAYFGSLVRTGDGTIDIAAAHNVELLQSAAVTYQHDVGTTSAKYENGGTAVYTVGHIATATPVIASTADGQMVSNLLFTQAFDDPSYLAGPYIPSGLQQFLQQPKLLTGGGAIAITAGKDVIGRQDFWAQYDLTQSPVYHYDGALFTILGAPGLGNFKSRIGGSGEDQLWRSGVIGQDTLVGVNPELFTAGIGALGGGNITIKAGGNVADLTIALDTGLVTANAIQGLPASQDMFATLGATNTATGAVTPPLLATLGGGNLALTAGGNVVGGQFDIASGFADVHVGGDVVASNTPSIIVQGSLLSGPTDTLRLRVTDADINAVVSGSVTMTGINALGTNLGLITAPANSAGFFSAIAGLNMIADGSITLAGDPESAGVQQGLSGTTSITGFVLPGTLGLAALGGDLTLGHVAGVVSSTTGTTAPYLLYPSSIGQLSLLASGSLANTAIAMLDSEPSLLPGAFSANTGITTAGLANSLGFVFPDIDPTTIDSVRRLFHSGSIIHASDANAVQIYVGGSLTDDTIWLPKQARIGAGSDIRDVYFTGQNINATDTTRITAGRDITGTTLTGTSSASTERQYVLANSFTLGGPGSFDVEAGRNLGPFVSSGVVNGVPYAGGILTVGNSYNPSLGAAGADLTIAFGIAHGADYSALRETYLDPANFTQLDGASFVQVADANGNLHPDRSQPIYAAKLALWLQANDPAAYNTLLSGVAVAIPAALASAADAKYAGLFAAFASLPQIDQNRFLINTVYFGELAAPADATSPSYQQYFRGYRAVQTLFPSNLGYTDDLATYTINPATISADHPAGVPARILVNGQPEVATRVETGNADLRLATIETGNGGNLTILGPGGNFTAGSVVRTSALIASEATTAPAYPNGQVPDHSFASPQISTFTSVPLGYEGVLTLRGGAIDDFTDGNFEVNQSRVFTLAGGDITMWSSNGDLAAGQGPKSASNFPPITILFSPDGGEQVNSAGSVSGAGIGAFKSSPSDPASSVILLAPAGEVDAGDAGVRASGNVIVAAARVANADNFKAGGSITGVPALSAVAAPVTPASAASAVAAIARIANSNSSTANDRSVITVEVTGFGCDDKSSDNNDNNCKKDPPN